MLIVVFSHILPKVAIILTLVYTATPLNQTLYIFFKSARHNRPKGIAIFLMFKWFKSNHPY